MKNADTGGGIIFIILIQQVRRKSPRRIAFAADMHSAVTVIGAEKADFIHIPLYLHTNSIIGSVP